MWMNRENDTLDCDDRIDDRGMDNAVGYTPDPSMSDESRLLSNENPSKFLYLIVRLVNMAGIPASPQFRAFPPPRFRCGEVDPGSDIRSETPFRRHLNASHGSSLSVAHGVVVALQPEPWAFASKRRATPPATVSLGPTTPACF